MIKLVGYYLERQLVRTLSHAQTLLWTIALIVAAMNLSGCEVLGEQQNGAPQSASPVPSIVSTGLILDLDASLANLGLVFPGAGTCAVTNWFDLSPFHNSGTLNLFAGCGATEGWNGNGSIGTPYNLTFDHTAPNQVLATLPQLNLSPTGQNTVELWLNWDGTTNAMPFNFSGNSGYDLLFAFGFFGFNTYHGDIYGVSSAPLANTWTQVDALFDNSSAESSILYINGVLQSSARQLVSPLPVNMSSNVFIGNDNLGADKFGGLISVIMVYNRPLSQAEISRNCRARAANFPVTCH